MKPIHPKTNENNIKIFDPKNFELTLERKATDDSFFLLKNDDFEIRQEEKRHVNSDCFFSLNHFKTRFCLGIKIDSSVRKSGKIGKTCWKPVVKLTASQEDALRFYQAVPHEIWETQFLLSCIPIIKRGIRLMKIVIVYYFKNFFNFN